MTHDWAKAVGLDLSGLMPDGLDALVTEQIQTAVRETVSREAPALTIDSLVETVESYSVIMDAIRRAQEADMERVEEAYVRALELDQGVFIATRESRVIYAEPSSYVPARMAYWANTDAWEVADINALFSGGFAPNIDR